MENKEIMEQLFENNRQNYMMDNNSCTQHTNMNVASAGCGDSVLGGIVPGDMISGVVSGVAGENLGVKYDEHHHEEHDVGDDDELKYIKEVQQSEKQIQQQSLKNFGFEADDGEHHEVPEKEISNEAENLFGKGSAGFVFGGDYHKEQPKQHQQYHDLFNIGNGHGTNGHDDNEEKLNFECNDIDAFKHETDFSSSINVTESAEGFVHQVDVKIDTKPEHQPEIQEEEEPSSLATNTTNGTSSLSENVPAPQVSAVSQHPANAFDDFGSNIEDKENTAPLVPQRPAELDLDLGHSQLNPDAKEFIPSFGSNPASPTSPFKTGEQQNNGVFLSEPMETQMYFGQGPCAVPRNLLNDDDFVAQSPRKGKGDNDLDTVPLPEALSDFESEANERPHELETEEKDGVMTPDQAIQQLPLDDLALDQQQQQFHLTDTLDFQSHSLMEHGPETCVDTELDMQSENVLKSLPGDDDVMKRSIYVSNAEDIEDVLNSVQPIPTEIDSVNNSFIEESATELAANQLIIGKELLQVEEKEHVSHSPSTEEMQMNLLNTLNSSNKDIPQLPIDMDNANNMQESMYTEHEDTQKQDDVKQETAQHLDEHQRDLLLEESIEEKMELQQEEQNYFHEESEQEKHEEEKVFSEPEQFVEKQVEEQMEQLLSEEIVTGKQSEDLYVQEQELHNDDLLLQPEQQETNDDWRIELEQYVQQSRQQYDKKEENHLTDTNINPSTADGILVDKHLDAPEQQQEFNEPQSTFKANHEIRWISHSDVLSPSSTTAHEKHLLEDTKEQQQQEQVLSVSGLEQQLSEMNISNNDGNLSQAEDIVATPATNTIEDISENLISPDEVAFVNQDQMLQHGQQEKVLLNDVSSFKQFEHQPEEHHHLQADADETEKQMEVEYAQEPEQEQHFIETANVTETEVIEESIESPIKPERRHDLESELVAVEKPILEVKQDTQLFTTTHEEETENETKIDDQVEQKIDDAQSEKQQQDFELCMVPETAPVELLEPPMDLNKETEQHKEEELPKQIEEMVSESIKETVVEQVVKLQEEESVKPGIPAEAAVVATSAAVAATAVAGAKAAATSVKKVETAKKPTSVKTSTVAAKPKVSATSAPKKPTDVAKKPAGLAAKPRTTAAPAKAATAATATGDKKPIAKTTTSTTSTTARKPLSATGTTASKVANKPASTTTLTNRTAATAKPTAASARPTTTPRNTATTTRKPTATSSSAASANGAAARPRPATAPAKPTTLGLAATNGAPKPKPTSPRVNLTSQVRKTASATTTAKSPVKSTPAYGVTKTVSSSLASKSKTTTSTTSSTATSTATKTFTARPAPKFTHSSSSTTTTTTTRRLTLGGTTAAASSTTTTTKTSSTPLRKSSPLKPATTKTPTKTTTGTMKSKTPVSKTASPTSKPAPIRKPVDKTAAATEQAVNKVVVNGDLEAVQQMTKQQQNSDVSIPMENEVEQSSSLLEATSDGQQIPMDTANA